MYYRTGKTNDTSICYDDMLVKLIEWIRHTMEIRLSDKRQQVCMVGYKARNLNQLCKFLKVLAVNIKFERTL